jgi:4-amino-4-deoxy-L-arabinose transferase-like glycosyltransferase
VSSETGGSRARFFWPLVSLFAVVVYLYSLGGFYVPHIGDEAPYIEITRLTAASGRLLPLSTAPGLENTKPPLLFWLGIFATDWGREWTLLRLRVPIVVSTFAIALVAFWLVGRLGRDRETAFLASLTFLGFYSTYQYGRPFLTNSPESLFVFLSFALVLGFRDRGRRWAPWVASGLALGLGCLFKSFALVAPAGLALVWLAAIERRGDRRVLASTDLPRVAVTVSIALFLFLLWPLLDPDPSAIFRHFVIEQNLGKLQGAGYWSGLFSGPYALQWLWLGPFASAGLFALPLLFLVVASLRERNSLSRDEKALWVLVLSFLLVYSIPRQRQENYLLPTVPALSILLALRWRRFSTRWFRWFSLFGVVYAAALFSLVRAVQRDALPRGSYSAWQIALLVALVLSWVAMLLLPSIARGWFHPLALASLGALAIALAPFEGPQGRYPPDRLEILKGRRVFVPSTFVSHYERHRFLLPGARVEGYDPSDANETSRLLDSGRIVVVQRPVGDDPQGPFRVIARRFDLSSRQTNEEMWRILVDHDLDLLVREELILRRYRTDRLAGERGDPGRSEDP